MVLTFLFALLVFLAGGTGVLFVTAFANESARVEERGTAQRPESTCRSGAGFMKCRAIDGDSRLARGERSHLSGEDANRKFCTQEELNRFEKRPAFDTISGIWLQ